MDDKNSTLTWNGVNFTAVTTGGYGEGLCIERQDSNVLYLTIIPVFAFLCNIVVLAAVVLHRSKLRQNNVYIYVFSLLICNIVFSILVIYQILNHYFLFEGDPTQPESGAVRAWWVFRKAFMTALYLVMVGNIGSLIYAIRAGNYIVAKATSAHALESEDSTVSSVQQQRRRAYLLISLSWIVPFGMCLFTFAGWSCGETCHCLSGCYSINGIERDSPMACSRVWTPMSNSFLMTTVVIWAVEMIVLFVMICKTLGHSIVLTQSCLSVLRRRKAKGNLAGVTAEANERTNDNDADHYEPCEGGAIDAADDQEDEDDADLDENVNRRGSLRQIQISVVGRKEKSQKSGLDDRRRRRYAKWLRVASKQLSYITVVFFVCTAPTMICLLIDFFHTPVLDRNIANSLMILPIVYSIICPIILAKDLAGLHSAMISLMVKLLPAKKTTTRHSETRTSTSVMVSDERHGGK